MKKYSKPSTTVVQLVSSTLLSTSPDPYTGGNPNVAQAPGRHVSILYI